jgi:cell wall assembly regulator SMI1
MLPVLSVVETTGAFVPLSWATPAWLPLIYVAAVAAGGAEVVDVVGGLVGGAGTGLLDDLVEGGVDVLGHA